MTLPSNEITAETRPARIGGCLGWGIFLLVWLWVVFITLGRLATQLVASGSLTSIPDSFWAAFPTIQAVLLLLPLSLLAWLSRSSVRQSSYRTWRSAAVYVFVLAPVSLLFPAAMQLHALLNILISLLYGAVLLRLARQPGSPNPHLIAAQPASRSSLFDSRQAVLLAVLITGAAGIPWGLLGALGSPLDTLLQVMAGMALGLAAVVTFHTTLLPGLQAGGLPYRQSILVGGFSAATALLVFASGASYAFGGVQALLALCLLPLGWLSISLLYPGNADNFSASSAQAQPAQSPSSARARMLPAVLLIGISAAFPLVFLDPDELALVISFSSGELFAWALAAAAGAALVAILASLVLAARSLLTPPEKASSPGRTATLLPVVTLLVWLGWLGSYFLFGQPGFYGEALFVVLEDQAEIVTASGTPDLLERRSAIYTTLVTHANSTQADLRRDLDRLHIDYTPYYLVNGLRINGGPLTRLWLQTRPEVAQVLQNPYLRPLPQAPPHASGSLPAPSEPQWNLTQIGADQVHTQLGITGTGVLIGQSDSGAQFDHPELADSYRGLDGSHDYSWFDPWNGTTQPADTVGHGTHTLGSVLGNSTGVAPGAQWIACANLARNLSNPAYYLDCLQFMFAPFPLGGDPFTDGDPARGPQVLNNSWGCPEIEGCRADTLLPAVQALNAAGVFVVVSAGNDGPFCSSVNAPLSIYAEVLSVGANDPAGGLAIYSSRGPVSVDGSNRVKPEIIAPGDQVLSAMPGNTYGTMSGTSMAGPHVAGTVALMWSANPRLVGDIETTRQILASTARPYPYPLTGCAGAGESPSTAVGYGLLDAYAAVQASLQAP